MTTCDHDEVGFRNDLARRLRDIYVAPGEESLFAQYHCPTDSHIPASVPPMLGALVRLTVAEGAAKERGVRALAAQLSKTKMAWIK
eukprot:SAG31_NODE_18573_length_631_cov_0.954887_1_plen_86_part_00